MPGLTTETGLSLAEKLALLSPEERHEVISQFPDDKIQHLLYDWSVWARPDQRLPDGNWFVWALISGRGAGKTRTGAETVKEWAGGPDDPPVRIALVAQSAPDARDVMIEGDSGILSVCPPWNRPFYSPSKRRLTWPNGSIAIAFSGDKPDQLRGPQFHYAWVDEIAKFQYPQDVWDNLELGLRLGDRPRVIVTTTPRPIPVIREMLQDPLVHVTRVSTYANISNLAPNYIRRVVKKYEGTRLGRQELHAQVLTDMPGALWWLDLIADNRVYGLPEMRRIVIGLDPSASTSEETEEPDEAGLVVCGKGQDNNGYMLRDESRIYTPDQWARAAIGLYKQYGASRIVAEKNQGGEMVRTVIHQIDRTVKVKLVTATKSKPERATPIAALMEQGRIKHLGQFAELEDQMCSMTVEDYEGAGSPDRMDAYVHAMTDLMLGSMTSEDAEDYPTFQK